MIVLALACMRSITSRVLVDGKGAALQRSRCVAG